MKSTLLQNVIIICNGIAERVYMIVKEYGNKNNTALILIHAGGFSDWMFNKHIEAFKQDYFLIVPIIDGHAKDKCEFVSIESSSHKLIDYLKQNYPDRKFYIYGISLGAQITMQMIAQHPYMFSRAIIESCLSHPQKLLLKTMLPITSLLYPLISKRWFSKIQAKALYIPDTIFEKYYIDSKSLSKNSLINITKSNMMFDVCSFAKNISTKILIVYGSKEISSIKKSAKKINHYLTNSNIKILDNMRHAEMLFIDNDSHIDYINNYFHE